MGAGAGAADEWCVLRLLSMLLFASLCSCGSYVAWTIWQQAAQNSASPGAVVLLLLAGGAALLALLAWIAVVVRLVRLSAARTDR